MDISPAPPEYHLTGGRVGLGFGQPRQIRRRHPEAGAAHPEGSQNIVGEIPIQGAVGNDFDDAAQHIGGHAVLEPRSRLIGEG